MVGVGRVSIRSVDLVNLVRGRVVSVPSRSPPSDYLLISFVSNEPDKTTYTGYPNDCLKTYFNVPCVETDCGLRDITTYLAVLAIFYI